MNLEKFLRLLQSNPTNLSIHYEKIGDKERLLVNGEEVTPSEGESYDDSHILKLIRNYKENIELLDSCVFVETMEEIGEIFDLKALDYALNQTHFTEEEAVELENCIGYINSIIHKKLSDKIQQSVELLERF